MITHTGHILDYVHASRGYVMIDGRIVAQGEAMDMLDCIRRKGYEECAKCRS